MLLVWLSVFLLWVCLFYGLLDYVVCFVVVLTIDCTLVSFCVLDWLLHLRSKLSVDFGWKVCVAYLFVLCIYLNLLLVLLAVNFGVWLAVCGFDLCCFGLGCDLYLGCWFLFSCWFALSRLFWFVSWVLFDLISFDCVACGWIRYWWLLDLFVLVAELVVVCFLL